MEPQKLKGYGSKRSSLLTTHVRRFDVARAGRAKRIAANIEQVIEGKHDAVRLGLAVLLAEGHLLIEDVPGVGKTSWPRRWPARSTARSADPVHAGPAAQRRHRRQRLQPETRDFEFKPGPVFANIVVGDEINRASPEDAVGAAGGMEEHQVTVDGVTYALEAPFIVIATQNPLDMEGTYPAARGAARPLHRPDLDGVPEPAVRDRHAVRACGRRPARPDHPGVGRGRGPGADRDRAANPRRRHMKAYAVDLATATRQSSAVRLGHRPAPAFSWSARPRRGPRSRAATTSSPMTCKGWCPCLRPPVLLTAEAHMSGRGAADVLASIVSSVPIPATASPDQPAAGAFA